MSPPSVTICVTIFHFSSYNHRLQSPLSVSSNSRIYLSTLSHLHDRLPRGKGGRFYPSPFFCKIFTLLNKPTKAIESCGGLFWVSPSVARVQFSICPWPRRGDKYKVLANLIWQVWLGQPIWLGLCRGGECNREYRVWRAKINCIYHFWTKIGILLP